MRPNYLCVCIYVCARALASANAILPSSVTSGRWNTDIIYSSKHVVLTPKHLIQTWRTLSDSPFAWLTGLKKTGGERKKITDKVYLRGLLKSSWPDPHPHIRSDGPISQIGGGVIVLTWTEYFSSPPCIHHWRVAELLRNENTAINFQLSIWPV